MSEIYLKPVDDSIRSINESSKTCIVIAGNSGSGKTTVLNELNKRRDSNIILDGTLKDYEYLIIGNDKLYNLYYICLTLKKMILSFSKKYYQEVGSVLFNLHSYLNSIIKEIQYYFILGNYCKYDIDIDKEILNNPEILIEKFVMIIIRHLNCDSISLLIDDFDKIGLNSYRYQQVIYKMFSIYLRLIISTEDIDIVNGNRNVDDSKEIIRLNYSYDIDVVKIILGRIISEYTNIISVNGAYLINSFFNDETIRLMIEITNGNIYEMKSCILVFLIEMINLSKEDYDRFILNYLISKKQTDNFIHGVVKLERKLYI